ncbi:MAG: hypothetical protein ACTSU2_07910 [Promethearchaeota archaeon]
MKKSDLDSIKKELNSLLKYTEQFKNKRIMLIGDAAIDHFIFGSATSLSPDAPVPLLNITKEFFNLGSLGKILNFIIEFGAIPTIISFIGNDYEGQLVKDEITNLNIGVKGLIKINASTPRITRVISGNQHIVRLEKRPNIPQDSIEKLNDEIFEQVMREIKRVDAVIICDYDVGLLNPILITKILAAVKSEGLPLIIRPEVKKYYLYRDFDFLYMNRGNAAMATNIEPINQTCIRITGNKLIKETNANVVFLPQIESDSYYFEKDSVKIIPTLLGQKPQSYSLIGSAAITLIALMKASGSSNWDAARIGHLGGTIAASYADFEKNRKYFGLNKLKKFLESM